MGNAHHFVGGWGPFVRGWALCVGCAPASASVNGELKLHHCPPERFIPTHFK